jgi:hypothetical protein
MKKLIISKEQAIRLYENTNQETKKPLNEGLTIELLEFTHKVIEFILNELNDDTTKGIDSFWRNLGVTRGELLSLLSDLGLIGVTFYKLSYSEKVRRIIDVIGILYKDVMEFANYHMNKDEDIPEGTGAAGSSGAFVGSLSGGMGQPVKRGIFPSQAMVTDDVNPVDKLKGLEVGTKTKRFIVSDVSDKEVAPDGCIFFRVGLTYDGEPISSHLVFKLDGKTNKATLKFNDDFESMTAADKAFPPVYHRNLNKIGKTLAKMAKMQDEGTGASANATYDAPGFDPGHKGKKIGPYTQNFNIYEKSRSPNLDKTTWEGGAFVEFDDCVKFNNNKDAQNGGCSQGDSGVVKQVKTKDSIIKSS